MFSSMLQAARPAALSRRIMSRSTVPLRSISTSLIRHSEGPPPPKLFGPGGKPGTVPTDFEQSTGLERLQMLGDIEGVAVFDKSPLDSSRVGTLADPIMVPSYDTLRLVGCTGSPADSHEVLWFWVRHEENTRCLECGSVYTLDFQGDEPLHEHEHEHAHAHAH